MRFCNCPNPLIYSTSGDGQNQHEEHEISVWFVLAGALLVVGAFGLSLRWNRT